MSPAEYKSEREQRGTQEQVAALLGVSRVTRCRWCETRLGEARVRLDGSWHRLSVSQSRMPTWYEWTDGICPVCLGHQKAEAAAYHEARRQGA